MGSTLADLVNTAKAASVLNVVFFAGLAALARVDVLVRRSAPPPDFGLRAHHGAATRLASGQFPTLLPIRGARALPT